MSVLMPPYHAWRPQQAVEGWRHQVRMATLVAVFAREGEHSKVKLESQCKPKYCGAVLVPHALGYGLGDGL